MRTIDYWLGRNLFIPIIIKLCQLTRHNQYQFASAVNFFAMLTVTYLFHSAEGVPLWVEVVFGTILWAVNILSFWLAAFAKNWEGKPVTLLRYLWLVITALELGDIWFGGFSAMNLASDILFLMGQYALLIDKIPPIEKEEKFVFKAQAE